MKKFLVVSLCMVMAFAAYLSMGTMDNTPVSAPAADAKAKSFSGTFIVAGHGGHFAKADITVDPSNTKNPIKINSLGMDAIGSGKAYIFHDVRIDANDRTKVFWSTYKPDAGASVPSARVGVNDLSTGKVLKDISFPLDESAKFTGALYCGSGQTKDNFMPMTMTKKGYIDVFDKATLKHKHRVFAEQLGFDQNYIFMHGNTSPDMKTMMVSLNGSTKWGDMSKPEFNKRSGVIHNMLLDSAALDNGQVKILKKNTVSGDKAKTFTFRQTFTPDGKLVLQSGADRAYILDGKSLKLKKEVMMKDGENHDVVSGPNGDYAILTLRSKSKVGDKTVVDGTLQLLDVKKGKTIGGTVSVCNACHKKDLGDDVAKAILCGGDVNWK